MLRDSRRHSFRSADADPHGPDYSADHGDSPVAVRFQVVDALLCRSRLCRKPWQSRSFSSSRSSTVPCRGAEADSHGPCDHGDSKVQDCLRIQRSAWFDSGYMHCVSLRSF